MKSNFERAVNLIAAHEGGFVDHPKDPGGRTMRGVTQRTYDAHNRRIGKPKRDVKHITVAESKQIFHDQYWMPVRGSDLPAGLAYCVFDASVNSGPARAAKWLQAIVGVAQDGIIGDQTLAAIRSRSIIATIDIYCNQRLAFMKSLKHWPTFKNGWARRVAEVRAQSKAWAAGNVAKDSKAGDQPQASGPKSAAGTMRDVLGDNAALGAITGLLGASGALASGDGPVQIALAIVLVIGGLYGIWWMVKGRHKR